MPLVIGTVKIHLGDHGYCTTSEHGEDVGYRMANGYTVLDFPSYFEPSFERLWEPAEQPQIHKGDKLVMETGFSGYGKPIAYRLATFDEWRKAKRAIEARSFRITREVRRGKDVICTEPVWEGRNLRELFKLYPLVPPVRTGIPHKDNPLIPFWDNVAQGYQVYHQWEVLWHGDQWIKVKDLRPEFARVKNLESQAASAAPNLLALSA